MKELGIQMLPAYSPPARGRSERNFGAWQGGRPQALRLADLGTLEAANPFLGERYMAEFNRKFTVPTKERGTAFRKTGRVDLDWIFSTQSERVVARDNPLAFPDQTWQWEKTRWRYSVAGCAVTVHEHLDGRISGRYGPQVVAGWQASGGTEQPKPRRGKGGVVENQTAVPPLLGNLGDGARFPLSRRADSDGTGSKERKTKAA